MSAENVNAWWWMQPSSNRSPPGKFPSIREKNREFCKFEGVATTCPRTNTRHYRRFSTKFPVRIEPGILLSNREFFLSNREFSNAKTGKPGALTRLRVVSPGRESACLQLCAALPYSRKREAIIP